MILFTAIAGLAIALHPAQAYQSNYSRVVQRPDPNNGYEDYIRATDLIHGVDSSLCLNWSPDQYDQLLAEKKAAATAKTAEDQWDQESENRLQIAKQLHDLTYLGVQRYVVGKYGGALALIRTGNEKRIWDPRARSDVTALFPELAGFKSLAKLIKADAYVKFADGDTRGATTDLLDGLTFSRRIGDANLIAVLVSNACQGILYASFEEHLPRLSDKDAVAIAKYADSAVSEPSSYAQAMQRERDMMLASLDLILAKPDEFIGPMSTDYSNTKGIDKFIAGLTTREKEGLKEQVSQSVNDSYSKLLAKLQGSESNWGSKTDFGPSEPQSIVTVKDAADELATSLSPSFDQATASVLKVRAQLRLLGLHARIIDYRWRTSHLPDKLQEAIPAQLLVDPMSQATFQYELKDYGYRLYSKGSGTTGPIELRYKRSAGVTPDNNNDPIPPRKS